jgi:DNA-binding MarR family transcriptional regulator
MKVTEDLAEDVGIHISDGNMICNAKTKGMTYSGHSIDDFPYFVFRFLPLLKQLWKTSRITCKCIKGEQTVIIRICSKPLVLFKYRVLRLPHGKKKSITIPKYFLENRQIVQTVIRGLFDGDGSLCFKSKAGLGHTYPVISLSSLSKPLLKQLENLLARLGFTVPEKLQSKNDGTTFILFLNGDKNYELWMNTIGLNNPKHLTKVALYEIFGMVPPDTGLVERVKLIRGDLKLSEIYPVKKFRVNNYRVLEKKVLSELVTQTRYINELGSLTNLDRQRIRYTLRRLSKLGFVECVKSKIGGKKHYQITQSGLNKLKRVNSIMKRLRDEFNITV